jgi:uncharacterized protein (TIGR03437 family)
MNRTFSSLALVLLLCAAAPAATISTTLTVNATATPSVTFTSFAIVGTTSMTGGIGTGKFASTVPLDLTAQSVTADYTITLDAGGTLTGKLTIPLSILGGGPATVTVTITNGTGTYSGATSGATPISLTGTVSGGVTTGFNLTNFTGSGTITTGGGGTTGPPTPTISTIQNNFGLIAPGLPNYGIAPSALFFIQGTALANTTTALLSSASPGLQTTVSGVTVTVTAGGTTLQCPLYYLSPTQVDAVLPGKTPVGNATITVNNNGGTSAAFPIVVVQSGFGILSYNGSLAAAYDANNTILTASNSANPNQVIVLWGSGVGYDPADDDKLYPQTQDNLTSIPMQAYVGGVQATLAYRGRSQFPGVDQVVLTIPGNVPTGCYVSLYIVSGNIVSNSTTIPIAASGRTCSDSNTGLTPDLIQSLSGKTTIREGILAVSQSTSIAASGTTTNNSVAGIFQSVSGIGGSQGINQVSVGSCLISNNLASSTGTTPTTTGLDAGASISVTGPAGNLTLSPLSVPGVNLAGFYAPTGTGTVPAGFIPASGGAFTFDNGSGGKDVSHFNTTLTLPAAFTWSNASSISSVTRSQGANVTWTGGASGTYVNITGGSTATINGKSVTVTFVCLAPVAAGQFTVPVPVLLSLPAGTGSLSVGDYTNQQLFTATGLDLGLLSGYSQTSKTPLTYN